MRATKAQQFAPGITSTQEATLNKKIDEGISERDMQKRKGAFFMELTSVYREKKYKERITSICGQQCFKSSSFRNDELSRAEMGCLGSCFNKAYRHFALSNIAYGYLSKEHADEDFSDI